MKARKRFISNPSRDEKLMLRVGQGDLDAFEEIYNAYKGSLGAFFYHLVWDRTLTEDYIQEVFLKLWKSAATYKPTAKFSTFLFQIAKNFWFSERRKLKRSSAYSLDASAGGGDDSFASAVMAPDPTPSTMMARAEIKAQIQDALEGLSDKQRVAFVMSEFQGLKYHEIAEVLDVPIGTVKSRMASAEKCLRKKLKRYEQEHRQ